MDNKMQSSNTSTKSFWTRFADWIITPSDSVQELGARRRAQLLSSMTLAIGTLNLVGVAFTPADSTARIGSLVLLSLLLYIAYGFGRTRFYNIGSWMVVIALSFLTFYSVSAPGADGQAVLLTYIPLTFALGLGLLDRAGFVGLVVGNIVIAFALPAFVPTLSMSDIAGGAGIAMTLGALLLIVNGVQIAVEKTRREELLKTNRELESLTIGLEQRVAERTKALETSAEVSRRLASILDPSQLASAVVNQVQTAFNYYYAQIYLFDDTGENLVLTASTGKAGAEMMKRGHALPKGRGLVGRAAENNQSILVSDTSQEPDWLPNELLPDTKAEAAIPIAIGDQVLGVLDVQDDVTHDITSDDTTLLESLASQVAISLQNARTYSEVQHSQEQLAEALSISRLANWEYDLEKDIFTFNDQFYSLFHTSAEKVGGYQLSSTDYARLFVHPEDAPLVGLEIQKAIESKERHFSTSIEHRVIFDNGETGYFNVRVNVDRDEKGRIIRWYGANQDVTERRQLEDFNRKRAAQQEAINTITQRIQAASTVEDALQVAARELGHALGNRQTLVAIESSALGGNGKTSVNE